MIFKYALFALICLALASPFYAAITEEEDVLVLNDENFEEAMQQYPDILVEFYAPWCGHCKKLAPEYAKAAKKLKKNDPPVALAKVDATENGELAQQFGVRGYPTLKIFKNGQVSDYEGGRTESTIVNYMKKKAGVAAKTLTSVEEVEAFISSEDAVFFGFFEDTSSAVAQEFLKVAGKLDDYPAAMASSAEIKSKYEVTGEAVVVFKKFDEGRNDMAVTSESKMEEIESFVGANTMRLIETFSDDRAKFIFNGPTKIHALIFADPEADGYAALETEIAAAAKEHRGEVLYVVVPAKESRVYDFFGRDASSNPGMVISDMRGEGKMLKYGHTGEMTSSSMTAFVKDMLAGKVEPELKSEELSEDDTTGPVVVVKGKSFKEIVMDSDKDVLLEFYAPWCGHCKALAPVYEELGEKLSGVDSVVIAKVDATNNDVVHPKVNVKGFPTLYFFPGNDKDSPVQYQGGRTLDAMLEYLTEKATTKFEVAADGADDEHDEL